MTRDTVMRFLLFSKIKPQMRWANGIYTQTHTHTDTDTHTDTHTHTHTHTHIHSSSVFKAIKKMLNFTERL